MARVVSLCLALGLSVVCKALPPGNDDDLAWTPAPQAWHQQAARIVDHRFTTFAELKGFALNAKKAGVSVLMLVQLQKSGSCPGAWYNGLQLCDHINGTYPIADGSLAEWQRMLKEIKPMRLMVWWNVAYWSVQGEVWKQAVADQSSDVGRWFSYGPNNHSFPTSAKCGGNNPCFTSGNGTDMCAQGSWGSDGMYSGVSSALASFGSPTYQAYLADAMANSWSKNLGIDGYTLDCSAIYPCMLQTKTAQSDFYNKIVGKVRETQPQVVTSGEYYPSWESILETNTQMGGQGFPTYHNKMKEAVFNGDVSNLEDIASSSGADAASVICYLHPGYDGKQPGGCPTMYFRDSSPTITNLAQHRFWVALEAGSGIISEHDYDPSSVCRTTGPNAFNGCTTTVEKGGAYWNVTNDPFDDEGESPLWAFTKHRALNRLALRTKLSINSGSSAIASSVEDDYTEYPNENCFTGKGGVELGQPVMNINVSQCKQFCDADADCDCVVYHAADSTSNKPSWCFKRTQCEPASFEKEVATSPFIVYVKKHWVPPTPPPKMAGGALAYLKHDSMGPLGDAVIMVFNPGAAQNVTIDLSALPVAFTDGRVTLYDLFTKEKANAPLTKSWTVAMRVGEAKAFGGFSLGVYAPRKGKYAGCNSAYNATSSASTLQACFLDCAKDAKCENVFVHGVLPEYMEKPQPITCTLLGAVSDPAGACAPSKCESGNPSDCGTLINQMKSARKCAELWETPTRPAAGAPPVEPGPPCTSSLLV